MPPLQKNLIITLMIDKFPEMKKYIHLLKWEPTDNGDFFGMGETPEPYQTEVPKWFNELQR